MDITCIPMARGFHLSGRRAGLVHRGRVLAWRLSITLEADFCMEAVEAALARHGTPEFFNTDQGSHASVSEARTSIGRCLAFDNRCRPPSSLDRKTPDQAHFNQPKPEVVAA